MKKGVVGGKKNPEPDQEALCGDGDAANRQRILTIAACSGSISVSMLLFKMLSIGSSVLSEGVTCTGGVLLRHCCHFAVAHDLETLLIWLKASHIVNF